MAVLNGKSYSKEDLLRYCGNTEQIAAVREMVASDGKANGLKIFNVRTGAGLVFDVLPSKCLDIATLSYKGVNISFLSKNGVTSENFATPYENNFLNHMSGGMLFTCGLRNVGGDCVDNGEKHPLHGRIGITPAQNVYARCYWENDDYIMELGGVVKETALFGHNLYLTRTLKTKLGTNEIELCDTVENLSCEEQELMLLYHFNFGFPFLDENTGLIFPENDVTPRTEVAKNALLESEKITKPVDGFSEHVFFRNTKDDGGIVKVGLENNELGIGAYIQYEKENLPNLTQWKSMKSGDYVLGIEPCNCFVKGRKEERENGTLKKIGAFSKLHFNLKIGFYDL